MSYKAKYGDRPYGKTHVKLDKSGRCYACQDNARLAAKAEREARVLGALPPIEPAQCVQETHGPHARIDSPNGEAAREWMAQRVGPRVEDAGEKLRGAIVPDKGLALDACQGWPETDGTLVIDGMEFEVVPSGKSAGIVNPVVSFRGSAIAFSADAVRKYGLDKLTHMRLHKAVGAVCFEVLAEPGPNTRKLYRQSKGAASLACTIHRLKKIFPGLSGRQFPLEATERPGFFLARVG